LQINRKICRLSTTIVSVRQANPKGFLETILVQIKLLWLKLRHPEAEIVKPLGFLTLLLNSYFRFTIGFA
jgi:hypothetical protein